MALPAAQAAADLWAHHPVIRPRAAQLHKAAQAVQPVTATPVAAVLDQVHIFLAVAVAVLEQ
jgi:hypothetical protein